MNIVGQILHEFTVLWEKLRKEYKSEEIPKEREKSNLLLMTVQKKKLLLSQEEKPGRLQGGGSIRARPWNTGIGARG